MLENHLRNFRNERNPSKNFDSIYFNERKNNDWQ